jgi:chaperone BCS1
MIFMTTNFRERLDSALTRPGRVDVSLKFSLATDEQILRLRDRLAPDWNDDEILVLGRGKTMAEVQQLLLEGTLQECNHFVAEEVKK